MKKRYIYLIVQDFPLQLVAVFSSKARAATAFYKLRLPNTSGMGFSILPMILNQIPKNRKKKG